MKFVIMAGGGGTRLWPVSRKKTPKQLLPFIGDKTLLQATYERLRTAFAAEDIFISSNINQKAVIEQQLPDFPEENLILEPHKRDTAAAIGFSAISLEARFGPTEFITINSDAYIRDVDEYTRIIRVVEQLLPQQSASAILIGIKPTYPETGYGYIRMGSQVDRLSDGRGGYDEVFAVEAFVEKPNLEKARGYVEKWEYLWNPAMVAFNTRKLLHDFQALLPKHYEILSSIAPRLNDSEYVATAFEQLEPISIDYGIMEKLSNMIVVPADFGWADVGHWRTVKDVLSPEDDNLIRGPFLGEDNQGNLIYNYTDKLISTIGLRQMIIIQTEDVLLICPKERSQDVKKIVDQLAVSGLAEYL